MRHDGTADVSRVTEAIVLAGGLGTRLQAVVSDVPKPMAPVAGRPFLVYLLDYLQAHGMERVILSVGYRHQAISAFFGRRHGALQLDYAIEEHPLGTGGGMALALRQAEEPFVFVLNGDTFLKLNYRAMSMLVDNPGELILAVALRQAEEAGRYGRAVVSGDRIEGFAAQGTPGPGWINAGVYLMERTLFDRYPVPEAFSFEADFLQKRVGEIHPRAFPCYAPFIDIGVPESFEQSQVLLPAWTKP